MFERKIIRTLFWPLYKKYKAEKYNEMHDKLWESESYLLELHSIGAIDRSEMRALKAKYGEIRDAIQEKAGW